MKYLSILSYSSLMTRSVSEKRIFSVGKCSSFTKTSHTLYFKAPGFKDTSAFLNV